MSRENAFELLADLDACFVEEAAHYEPPKAAGAPERIVRMSKKRIITFALAAALLLALSVTAYAAWSIHTARQQELKADLQIEEKNVSNYVEFNVSEDSEEGVVLLSAVNDGQEERLYVNVSPVTEAEAAGFPKQTRFFWRIDGDELGGFAGPQLPANVNVSGEEAIRAAVEQYAYDAASKTMTLECYVNLESAREAMERLHTDVLPLQVGMAVGEGEARWFGTLDFSPTREQKRSFDFSHAVYHDRELDREIEILSLELTPFSAVWRVHYEGDASFHTPEADWDAYRPWSILEDRICMETQIIFSDGSSFSTGGALTTPYENGAVNLSCGWGSAIDINDVQRIVLGDQILWQK